MNSSHTPLARDDYLVPEGGTSRSRHLSRIFRHRHSSPDTRRFTWSSSADLPKSKQNPLLLEQQKEYHLTHNHQQQQPHSASSTPSPASSFIFSPPAPQQQQNFYPSPPPPAQLHYHHYHQQKNHRKKKMGHFLSKLFGSADHNDHQNNNQQTKIANQHDQAILDIKITRDKITKYQKQLEVLMNRELEIAKSLLAENKRDRAKLALQKRKYQEQLYQKATAQLSNLQQMVQQIEFAQIESQVVNGIRMGKDALVAIQKEIGSIEQVEQLMDETREAIEYHNEISRVLSENLTQEDQEGVDEEYAKLVDLVSLQQGTTATVTTTTITTTAEKTGEALDQIVVPVHVPKPQEQVEEEEEEEEEVSTDRVAVAL